MTVGGGCLQSSSKHPGHIFYSLPQETMPCRKVGHRFGEFCLSALLIRVVN